MINLKLKWNNAHTLCYNIIDASHIDIMKFECYQKKKNTHFLSLAPHGWTKQLLKINLPIPNAEEEPKKKIKNELKKKRKRY